ncbi:hypothetical protein DFP73DRAFT_523149 [Morchella snyderi]|nr:hypothetical protein DFP73DRAFT_523149 [Morchella snyderi]
MRYQQQRAQMSPNWREKEAMSTQKLMAATTHLHLKQDEEIIRLRRNVSSLAKKNHELMRQVHELVSRLRQYPPPRIPEETRPTNQGEKASEDSSPEAKEDIHIKDTAEEDTQMKDTVEQENMAYEILPDWAETPTPTPTPPIQQAPPPPTPSPTPSPTPTRPTTPAAPETSRSGQTPPTETPIPIETHPDEVVGIAIMGLKSPEAKRQTREWEEHKERKDEVRLTLRAWMWFNKIEGRYTIAGAAQENSNYNVVVTKKGTKITINLEEVCIEDLGIVEFYSGTQMTGFRGPGGVREIVQIELKEKRENGSVTSRHWDPEDS